MGRRIEQGLMLVLPVEFRESDREIPEAGCCCQRAIDERSAAPLTVDFTADDDLAIAVLEHGLNDSVGLAGSNEVGRCTAAQQQPDRLDQNGFPRSRLPGEHVEPRLELDLDGLDHREVSNAEEAEHAGGTSIVSYV